MLGNYPQPQSIHSKSIRHWSLRSLLVKLIKIGEKVVRSDRYVWFKMAEVTVTEPCLKNLVAYQAIAMLYGIKLRIKGNLG